MAKFKVQILEHFIREFVVDAEDNIEAWQVVSAMYREKREEELHPYSNLMPAGWEVRDSQPIDMPKRFHCEYCAGQGGVTVHVGEVGARNFFCMNCKGAGFMLEVPDNE